MKAIRNGMLGIALMLFGLSQGLYAQTSIDRYFDQYQEDERFSSVSVSSRMFDLFMDLEADDPDETAFLETISKLDGFKALIGANVPNAASIYQDVMALPANDMEELMSVTDSQREFRFYITESDGTISELLMVGYEDESVMMMSLTGDIDLRQISALSKKMNIQGFEHFNKVK